MANNTYTAVLLDAPGGEESARYPGLFVRENGTIPRRILVRYTDGSGESRVRTYELVGEDELVEEQHRTYVRSSDDPYTPGKPDDDDWLIDAPGDRP